MVQRTDGINLKQMPTWSLTQEAKHNLLSGMEKKEIQQEWIFPSQVDCLRCHMKNSGWALGFNTAQLNRDILIGENQQNIIHAMDDAGYFDRPIIEKHILPKFAALDDHLASEEYRVRTYLDVNCSFCHQPGGAARSGWDARIFCIF